jgi:hypothetical protein
MRVLFAVLSALLLLGCADSAVEGPGGLCSQVQCNDGDDCTEDVCDATDPQVCLFFRAPENTPCNGGGICDGAGGCVDCVLDEQCGDDDNQCTRPRCNDGACGYGPVSDGSACEGGTCRAGRCELSGFIIPCTEQGIRNAIAAGGGAYSIDCNGPRTVTTAAEIVIDNDVVIAGNGDLTVHGSDDHRVFSVLEGATVWLDGISVTGGFASDNCGGLSNAGTLQLTNSVVVGNAATFGGGGICNSGMLTIENSRVLVNRAQACAGIFNNGTLIVEKTTVGSNIATSGGGGVCSSVMLTLSRSTIAGNVADHAGGVENSGTLTLSNSTVSSNTSRGAGSGLWNSGVATVTNTTLSGNAVEGDGGDIRNVGMLVIESSLVEGDCSGDVDAISSNGYNIESVGDTCGFQHETDQVEVQAEDLRLESLENNGGPTVTNALLPGSVAINRIPAVMCEPTTDQRGVARPQGAMCDVGAFELEEGGT